ncbi:MAG TPA: rhodoquinone biosynthesis methyltransferase RquA [Gammaproteobacteria bacterium]
MPHPLAVAVDQPLPAAAPAGAGSSPLPGYLERVYWWAYVHPRAIRLFEREWLVNAILFGNYSRLCTQALEELGDPLRGDTLQLACVYGNLTPRLSRRLAPDARLEVVDIVPLQLDNLRAKLPADARVTLTLGDASALQRPTASVDRALLFFLLHEQPEEVRRATLAEVVRVVRPGGRIVIVDYHRPLAWHPLRPLLAGVFRTLEPFAMDLWDNELWSYLPGGRRPESACKRTCFGGLYQQLAWTR